MAAAAAAGELTAGAATLGDPGDNTHNVPITWETSTEDAIEHALSADPDLELEITRMLDTSLALSPDRKISEITDEDTESLDSDSPGVNRDSDNASTSSSARDNEELPPPPIKNGNGAIHKAPQSKTVITVGKSSSQTSREGSRDKDDEPEISIPSTALGGTTTTATTTSSSSSHPPSRSSSTASSQSQTSKKSSKEDEGDEKDKSHSKTNGKSSNDPNRLSVPSNGSSSSSSSGKNHRRSSTDSGQKSSIVSASASDSGSIKGSGSGSSSFKNPLSLLKRLSKSDKGSRKKGDFKSEFSAVVIDRLPQVFVVKYLGQRPVAGICGLHHVRKPVDQMVREVKDKMENNTKAELPLLYAVVSPKGIDLREHKQNKVKDVAPLGVLPIDFISYGVQDIKYWRVFVSIVVYDMSSQSRTRTAACHAFLCDSNHNGRKMALALGAAFSVYSKKLKKQGKENNFQVELRPPDELAEELEVDA